MSRHRRHRSLATGLILALLTACKVGPDYVPPEPELPDAWHQAAVEGMTEGAADLRTWWTVFEDPDLDELIQRAGEGNLDLVVAAARIREARSLRRITAADRVPTVDATGSAGRQKFSEDVIPISEDSTERYTIGLDATWEIDVWGRVSRSVASADAGIQASVEDYRDVLVLLYAEVALGYVEVRSLQERIRYTEGNIESQRGTLQLTQDRFNAQIAPELDVRQAELNLASTEASLPALRAALQRSLHRLAVLLGQQPDAVYGLMNDLGDIPEPPQSVSLGIPADVLRRRPDIRAVERSLAAQTELIGVATAELYPQFALTGSFGWDALSGSSLFDPVSQAWTVAVPFRWNLFDRGRIKGNIAVQEARTDQLQAAYEQTLLLALEEVENSLVSYGEEQLRRDALARSVVAAQRSVTLVDTLYRSGLADFQRVLDSERALTVQQDRLAESEGAVAQNLVLLYRSLGGGWDPEPEEPESEQPQGDQEADE